MKKLSIRILVVLVIFSLLNTTTYAAYFNLWKAIQEAVTYEENGQLDKALPLWLKIIEHYEKQEMTEDVQTNLAIFSKKVGLYYDSIRDYENAVKYYEKENKYWNAVGKPWGAEDMIRAEEIRTIFQAYVEVAADESIPRAKYEPLSGLITGIYSENDRAVGQVFSRTKTVFGKHAQYLLYQDWNQRIGGRSLDVGLAKRMKAENASFQLAMNAMKGLDTVTENTWIVNWAKEAQKLDMPIFLRFLGEMNGDWVPWHGDAELYKEKFRLVHDIMEEYAPNVVMVWTPNDSPIELNGYRIEDYYPGDDYVDWVGVNFYIDYYDSGNVYGPNNHLQNPLAHLDYVYNMYADRKPIFICEVGVSHRSLPNDEELTEWGVENLKKLYSQLPIVYPRVKGITYFSLNQNNRNYVVGNRWNNYAISENDLFEEAYKALIQSKYYLDEMGDTVDTTFEPLDGLTDFRTYDEIYFYIKIPDYRISKVEFYHGESLLGHDLELPYSYKGDLGDVDELTIRVYDAKGDLALTKVLTDFVEEEVPLGPIEVHSPYVSGYADGSFRPEAPVTRAEVATMFARAMGLNVESYESFPYKDINQDHWSYHYVQTVTEAGIFGGYSSHFFKPDQAISRRELAQVLANYLTYIGYEDDKVIDFAAMDLDEEDWSYEAVRLIANTDLLGDIRSVTFKGDGFVSRGEVVAIINDVLGRPTFSSGLALFDDIDQVETLNDIKAASQVFMRQFLID